MREKRKGEGIGGIKGRYERITKKIRNETRERMIKWEREREEGRVRKGEAKRRRRESDKEEVRAF